MKFAHLSWFFPPVQVWYFHPKTGIVLLFFQACLVTSCKYEVLKMTWVGMGFYCVQAPPVYICLGLHWVFVKNLFGCVQDYQTTSWKSSILVCHSLMIQRLFKVRCAEKRRGHVSTGRYVNQMYFVEGRRCRMIMCSSQSEYVMHYYTILVCVIYEIMICNMRIILVLTYVVYICKYIHMHTGLTDRQTDRQIDISYQYLFRNPIGSEDYSIPLVFPRDMFRYVCRKPDWMVIWKWIKMEIPKGPHLVWLLGIPCNRLILKKDLRTRVSSAAITIIQMQVRVYNHVCIYICICLCVVYTWHRHMPIHFCWVRLHPQSSLSW